MSTIHMHTDGSGQLWKFPAIFVEGPWKISKDAYDRSLVRVLIRTQRPSISVNKDEKWLMLRNTLFQLQRLYRVERYVKINLNWVGNGLKWDSHDLLLSYYRATCMHRRRNPTPPSRYTVIWPIFQPVSSLKTSMLHQHATYTLS
jgi:hypothetical protein